MREANLTLPEIILLVGIGLLISGRLNRDQRKTAGVCLAVIGGLTTIPLALTIKSSTVSARRVDPLAASDGPSLLPYRNSLRNPA